MNEQAIFLAALNLTDPAERSAYLIKACAGDSALLQKVETLFVSHGKPWDFVEMQALEQMPEALDVKQAADSSSDDDIDLSYLTQKFETLPATHEKSGDFLEASAVSQMSVTPDVTQAEGSGSRENIDLSYLTPSAKPDSLGTLGHYEILQVLGQGGFGTVLKAFDEKLHRLVAIKVLSRQLAATSPPRKRFLREARSVAAIKNENVIAIYSVEEQPLPYFAMEFVDGATLQEKMDESGPIPVSEILHIGKQIASGLAAAHSLGLIHRDIKPANVLLEKGVVQKVKITDFGLARAADDASMTQSGMIAGTPLYMAPEQAKAAKLDARTDLFSLGSVLYALATGHPPFRAPSAFAVLRRVTEDTPRSIQEVISDIPDWLVAVIDKLLAKDPNDRFQSAQELVDVLAQCQSELQAGVPVTAVQKLGVTQLTPSVPVLRAVPTQNKFPVAGVATGVLLMSIVMAAGLFFLNKSKSEPSVINPNGPLPATFTNSIGMEFVRVPKGTAWLGGGSGQPGDKKLEIEQEFYIGKYEVTQEEWETVMGLAPSHFSRTGAFADAVKDISDGDLNRFPVEMVSWEDCQLFIERLNTKEKDTGRVYRLPKEAEWEYACRGGPIDKLDSAFDFYVSKPTNMLMPDQANFKFPKALKRTIKVGSYEPNVYGLHDMHGNVWEWCEDAEETAEGASIRVYRGGCWNDVAARCRTAIRYSFDPSYRDACSGLRLAMNSSGVSDPAERGLVASTATPDFLSSSTRTSAAASGLSNADRMNEQVRIREHSGSSTNTVMPSVINPNGPLPATFTNSIGMEFVKVPKGTSWLGGWSGQPGNTKVEIEQDFYLSKYEVTQEEWEAVTGLVPSRFSRNGQGADAVKDISDKDLKRLPVEQVSWNDCQSFIEELNKMEKAAGRVYRLPKEAEWEYACRGGPGDKLGSAFDFSFSAPTTSWLPNQANMRHSNALNRTAQVGSYEPNVLGLHDMHGNVSEWCDDVEKTAEGDLARVIRGGSWDHDPGKCRSAHRFFSAPSSRNSYDGFRLAVGPSGVSLVAEHNEKK